MRRKYYICLTITAALFAACDHDEMPLPADAAPIAFSAVMADMPDGSATTRGDVRDGSLAVSFVTSPMTDVALTRSETDLASLKSGEGFGVFAEYTGTHRHDDSSVRPDFMYNQRVSWYSDSWTYSPLKYWPSGKGVDAGIRQYVSFFAYAPYSDLNGSLPATNPAGYCISGFSNAGDYGDPWLTYRLIPAEHLAQQVDLLYAQKTDQTDPMETGAVVFTFTHALACVGDEIILSVKDDLKEELRKYVNGGVTSVELRLVSVDVTYSLTAKGRLPLWDDGMPSWQTIQSGDHLTERTLSLLSDGAHALYTWDGSTAGGTSWTDTGHGVYCLPVEALEYPQQAALTISYQVVLNGSMVFSSKEDTATVPLGYQLVAGERLGLKVSIVAP